MSEKWVTIAEAARQLGRNRSTLFRQKNNGLFRTNAEGLVKVSEVRAAREQNLNQPSGGKPAKKAAAPAEDDSPPPAEGSSTDPSFSRARAVKETYAAQLMRLQYQLRSGQLVDAEKVRAGVETFARQDRDRLMNWPAQNGPIMAAELGVDPVKLTVMLEKYVRKHLEECATLPLEFRFDRGDASR